METIKSNRCPSCGINEETLIPHTCPYAEEINDDFESICWCCEECTQECSDDI